MFARNLTPPYYAAIFSNQLADDAGYSETAAEMMALAHAQNGFLGAESARDTDGFGITISYWETEAAIAAWKANGAHLAAQDRGHRQFYEHFELRVGRIDRAYSGPDGRDGSN